MNPTRLEHDLLGKRDVPDRQVAGEDFAVIGRDEVLRGTTAEIGKVDRRDFGAIAGKSRDFVHAASGPGSSFTQPSLAIRRIATLPILPRHFL